MSNQEQYDLMWKKAKKYDSLVGVLDKIRAEIEKAVWEDILPILDETGEITDEIRIPFLNPDDVFEILDKYKIESEEK